MLKALLNLGTGFPTVTAQLDRQAARMVTNRVIAGVHFPVDSMAGRMLGVALGEYFVGRCMGGQTYMARKFIAAGIDGAPTTDFNPFSGTQALNALPFYSQSAGATIAKSDLMEHVWDKAQYEWDGKFGL